MAVFTMITPVTITGNKVIFEPQIVIEMKYFLEDGRARCETIENKQQCKNASKSNIGGINFCEEHLQKVPPSPDSIFKVCWDGFKDGVWNFFHPFRKLR